jgi:hypothetical protein
VGRREEEQRRAKERWTWNNNIAGRSDRRDGGGGRGRKTKYGRGRGKWGQHKEEMQEKKARAGKRRGRSCP